MKKTTTEFSPELAKSDFMIQEWESLMDQVKNMPPEASVNAVRTWSEIIRAGLQTPVWKN